MIRLENIVKYHGTMRILDGASLEVPRGQVAALVGPSGGGKSTLLRCINGLEEFQDGEIAVGDTLKLTGGIPTPKGNLLKLWRTVCWLNIVFIRSTGLLPVARHRKRRP